MFLKGREEREGDEKEWVREKRSYQSVSDRGADHQFEGKEERCTASMMRNPRLLRTAESSHIIRSSYTDPRPDLTLLFNLLSRYTMRYTLHGTQYTSHNPNRLSKLNMYMHGTLFNDAMRSAPHGDHRRLTQLENDRS